MTPRYSDAQGRLLPAPPGRCCAKCDRFRPLDHFDHDTGICRHCRGLQRTFRERAKREALDHYGRACACCGEADHRFLTIDHTGDDGAAHRRAIGFTGAGWKFYVWLRQQDYPDGFETACWNCNSGRHYNGGVCPHNDPQGAA